MPLANFDAAADAIRKVAAELAYIKVEARPDDDREAQPDPVVNIALEATDPLLRSHLLSGGAPTQDQLIEALILALRDELESYCEDAGPCVLRVRLYRQKGDYLSSRTLHSSGRSRRPASALAPELAFRPDTIDDLLVQRLVAITHNVQLHNEQMGGNYQRLFDVAERILVRAAGLNEQRAVRAEAHVLDLWDKRIAEKRATHEIVDSERRKDGDVAVKEKAIETAGSVFERLAGGVLGALGIDPAAAGKFSGLMSLLDEDPELKAAIADPATIAALKNPDVRGVVKGMLQNFKNGTLDHDAEDAPAPPAPEASP
jgi:hypothetical protein